MLKDKVIEKMATYISSLDIDEDICKRVNCRLDTYEVNELKCIECIKEFFTKDER